MAAYTLAAYPRLFLLTGKDSVGAYGVVFANSCTVAGIPLGTRSFSAALASSTTFTSTSGRAYIAGTETADAITWADSSSTAAIFSSAPTDSVLLAGLAYPAVGVVVSSGMTLSGALSSLFGVVLAEALSLDDSATTAASILALALSDNVLLQSLAGQLYNLLVADTLTTTSALSVLKQLSASTADTLTLGNTATTTVTLGILAEDTLALTSASALKAIFSATLADQLQVSVAAVQPGGTTTAWAINTRTAAVTEYLDYNFTSFAQVEHHCYGATGDGLYLLQGATDSGKDVVGSIAGGYMQPGGSHLSGFKAAYIGTSQEGDFRLKLVAGSGESYTYAVRANGMQSTRVNLGKGLRARYFRYELTAVDGHDFDLDSLEFLPLVFQRRVR